MQKTTVVTYKKPFLASLYNCNRNNVARSSTLVHYDHVHIWEKLTSGVRLVLTPQAKQPHLRKVVPKQNKRNTNIYTITLDLPNQFEL
jgi:hypothetical protein